MISQGDLTEAGKGIPGNENCIGKPQKKHVGKA